MPTRSQHRLGFLTLKLSLWPLNHLKLLFAQTNIEQLQQTEAKGLGGLGIEMDGTWRAGNLNLWHLEDAGAARRSRPAKPLLIKGLKDISQIGRRARNQ